MGIVSGLRRVEVVDTSEFADLGKIKIRVLGIMPEDAWEYADVMTPFGGLPNMGMQALPAIGSIGFALFEREQDNYPVWIGGLLHSWGEELDEGYANPVEAKDPTDFIIKTQYTKFDDQELESDSNKVENIFKMSENEFTIAKVRQDADNYSYKKEEYELEDEPYHVLKFTDEEIKIKFKFKDNSKSNALILNEDEANLIFDTDAGEMSIKATEDYVTLIAKGSEIKVNKDGDIEIMADGKVKLNGDGNTAVLYEALRDFINQSYNSHTHGTPAGPSSPPMSPYTQSSSLKSQSVKLE